MPVVPVGFISFADIALKSAGAERLKYRENVANKVAGLREMGEGRWLHDLEDMLKERPQSDLKEENSKEGGPKNPLAEPIEEKTKTGTAEEPIAVRMQPASAFTFDRIVAPTAEFLATAGLIVVLVVFMLIQAAKSCVIACCNSSGRAGSSTPRGPSRKPPRA